MAQRYPVLVLPQLRLCVAPIPATPLMEIHRPARQVAGLKWGFNPALQCGVSQNLEV